MLGLYYTGYLFTCGYIILLAESDLQIDAAGGLGLKEQLTHK